MLSAKVETLIKIREKLQDDFFYYFHKGLLNIAQDGTVTNKCVLGDRDGRLCYANLPSGLDQDQQPKS